MIVRFAGNGNRRCAWLSLDRMRLFAALAVVLVALLVATVRYATRQRASAGVTAAVPVEDEAPGRAPPPAVRAGWPPAGALALEPARGGIAHLHGRVLMPGECDPDTDVIADDGARSFKVDAAGDCTYSFHLPPGRYELVATTGELAGAVPDVAAPAGAQRQVDIPLARGAEIRGVLRPSGVTAIAIAASFPDRSTNIIGKGDAGEDGSFSITGLVPGRRYDIHVAGREVKTARLRGVAAPADNVEVALELLPVVRGAFGFPRGDECPISYVVVAVGDASASTTVIGSDCRFERSLPEEAAAPGIAVVTATGDGWHVEQTVAIPARGDPEPICLNPPCRADPLEGRASVRVTMERAGATLMTIAADGGGGRWTRSASCTDAACVLDTLVAGRSYRLTVSADGCGASVQQMVLPVGETSIRAACRQERAVEGLVHTTGAPRAVAIRCSGERKVVRQSRLFRITCDAADTALEYQTLPNGTWRSAPIPTAQDPALVEITL